MSILIRISVFLILAGCRIGPAYHPPEPYAPSDWKGLSHSDSPVPQVCNWWEIFDDPVLNDLEEQAIINSPNLYIALEHVEEARALAGVSKADLYPQFNLNPNFSNTVTLFKLNGLSAIPLLANTPIQDIIRVREVQYNLLTNVNYELDLWGKIRSDYESSLFHAEAEAWGYYSSLLTLTTDLANSYFALRTLDSQINILELTLKDRSVNLLLNQSRYEKGIASYIDVTEAELDFTNTESDYIDTVRQRRLQENMIAALIGLPASTFSLAPNPLTQSAPPAIPAGVPSDILLQRPDIAQSERQLASEHALIGSAYASLLPSISLTAAYGYASPSLHDFLLGKSRFWSYGYNIVQTLFDGFRKVENINLAKARYGEALGSYLQNVLTAFQEVEDALNNLEYQHKQQEVLKKSVEAAIKTVNLSERRYKQGLVNYFEVVTNQRTALNTERAYASVLGLQYQSTVQLIKALGGEWNTTRACDGKIEKKP